MMHRFQNAVRGFSCLLMLLFISLYAASAQQVQEFDTAKLDDYLQVLHDNDKFMGSVTVLKNGEAIFNKAYGLSHKQPRQVAAEKQTIYRIGSITKLFTSVMIMQLAEENQLALSQTLDQYYPQVAGADSITIRHLLAHRSGLFNFTNREDYQEWMTEQRSREQMLDMIRSLELEFEPGEKTSYSNTNYVLLGYIIEDITGDSYASQLQKRIAQPLGLTGTYYGDGIELADNEAASFNWNGTTWEEASETDMSIPHGAGAIVSTPKNLTTFIRALFRGRLVSEQSLDRMTDIEQQLGLE
ncbi:MAG: serine hydrolase domain-containing protein [Balneolaceae bacterium]|nr:serine hydrolase domain-containing protein [Balneolaceae bacterium]